jgi:hypothetical protein
MNNPRKTAETTENHKKNMETIENQKNVGESNNKCTARCLPTTPGPWVSWRVA